MADELTKLEKALGGKIERQDARVIPGVVSVAGQEVIYFSDDHGNPRRAQFLRLTRQVNPPLLKSGGASELGCTICSPDGMQFHAMAYHGDIEGWRKQIALGAKQLGLLTAKISGSTLEVSDGREVKLVECKVKFD
jgi:hypothetical protein